MSKQWTVENDTGAELTVRAPNGFAVELDASSADPRERFAFFAIRQQARDIEQLRAELAAAVAERDEWKECAMANLAERDTLRARLAAIDAAPAIARIESLPGPRGGAYLYIMGVESPPNVSSGTELIARPAKE